MSVTITLTWATVAAAPWWALLGMAARMTTDERGLGRSWLSSILVGVATFVALGVPLALVELAAYGLLSLLGWL